MHQKIDRYAMIGAGILILLAIVWSFVGSDPGAASAIQIEKHRSAIDSTLGEQSGLDLENPPAIESEVRTKFEPPKGVAFPEWTFYRRPATYWVQIIIPKEPPVLDPGVVCKVEVIREKGTPNRVFHRLSGLRGTFAYSTLVSEVLERREGKDTEDATGEWVEVGPVGAGEPGSAFEMEIAEGLATGTFSAYRLRSRAKSANELEFAGGGGLESTVESAPSANVYLPPDLAWEVLFLQGQVPGQVPMATLALHIWSWEEMKSSRPQAYATEKDGKPLFGTDYTLDLIRFDRTPHEVMLKGSQGTLKLLDGVKPHPLDPKAWESDDPRCTGAGAEGEGTAGAKPPAEEPAPEEPKPAPASGGGLFGGDD